MKKKKKKSPIINNLVAKHASEFNKSVVHDDKKLKDKNGYSKHKLKEFDSEHYSQD